MLTWDTAREFERLQEQLNGLFSGSYGTVHEFPAVNVWTNENGAVVTAELPGLDAGDLDISVVGDTLTLKGSRRPQELKEGERFHRSERMHGQFSRSVRLPFHVESARSEASMSGGVLNIKLPRAEADKPRKIEIRAA